MTLVSSAVLAHAAPPASLREAQVQDEHCLLSEAYASARGLEQRRARIDAAVSACIRLERGTAAWQVGQLASRREAPQAGSPRVQDLLERSRAASRRWLEMTLAYCRGASTAALCQALLERTTPVH